MTVEARFQNVFITGASSGIGRELARELAPTARVFWICGRDERELQVTRDAILNLNARADVHCLIADLALDGERQNLIDQVIGKSLDLVILNAGAGGFGLFRDSVWEAERRVIDLNVTATVHLAHSLLPVLERSAAVRGKRSAIVFVSSHAAFMRVPHFSVYASAKSFINSFALTLVQELRGRAVDVLLVCPGATATKFSARAGLPRKMLSTPADATSVARRAMAAVGNRNLLILNPFDRVLFWASGILPVSLFDAIVARMQRRLLARATESGS